MADISKIILPNGNEYNLKDSAVPMWAKAQNKPSYTAFEVGALSDTTVIPTKTSDLTNDSDFMSGMTILAYGKSTWADFLTAYTAKHVVYCRASSNANPATGSQTRMAFMAYVNNEMAPTNVEFQYYRSVNGHSVTQQGDQVYVYKLDKNAGWTVIVRECYTRIVAGTNMTSSYSASAGTLTLNFDGTIPSSASDIGAIAAPSQANSGDVLTYDGTNWGASAASGTTVTDMQDLTLSSMTTSSDSFPVPAIGETGKVLWGKVVKWFSDMSTLVASKLNVANLVNGFTQTTAGTHALDAAAGKTLNDKIDQRIGVSGVTGMQIRGSAATNNIGIRVYKNSANTAWIQETLSADNATLTVTKREAGESTDTNVATIYSAGEVLKKVGYTYDYTIAANESITITGTNFGVSTPSGYSIAGATSWFTGNQYVFAYRFTPQNVGANAILSLHNTSNAAVSGTASVTILYAKSIMNS